MVFPIFAIASLGGYLLFGPAITTVVTTAGFGAGGIAAGSMGAAMMSLGGGVTPVAVSVLQSIGATGMIAATTKVAVGVAAGTGAAYHSSSYDKKK